VSRVRASPRKACKVCRLPASELDLVDGGILSGWSPRSLAARFSSINRKDVTNHMQNCVSETKEQECESMPMTSQSTS
jgi:hypothetical protein